MLFSQDVVADTKGSFVSVKSTFKLWTALTYGESMVLHKIGVVGPTIDEQYNRVSQHFLLLLMSQSVEGSNPEIALFCSALLQIAK